MENDASPAGVMHGGLFSTAEIKILICYILSSLNEPVPANLLVNVLHYEGIANAFEVSDAIVLLSESGQICQNDKKDDTYVITESGKNVADTLSTSLAMTTKDRALKATIKTLSHFKNAKDTSFEITKEGDDTFITCSALDGQKPFLSVKLLVTDDAQANFIKKRFLENPTEIYSSIIEWLTKQ